MKASTLLGIVCVFLLIHIGLAVPLQAQNLTSVSTINAGGDPVDVWTGDTDLAPDPNLLAGSANIETIRGTATVDASVPADVPLSIFETMRIDANQPEPFMAWSFEHPAYSTYEIRLFFIEMSRCSVGSRVFDVEINGEIVEEDLDVYAEAGNQCDVGFMRSYVVEIENELEIRFPLVNGKPSTVAGIQILWYGYPPVEIVAGTGDIRFTEDGFPALETDVTPRDIAINQAGDIYYIDEYYNDLFFRIRKIDHETSIVTTVLGASPEPNISLFYEGIAFDTSDNLYFSTIESDSNLPQEPPVSYIKKMDAITGEISIIAGNGERGFEGDGGPALEAQLADVSDIHIDADNNIFLRSAFVIRRIDGTSGIIETVAGNGSQGFSGDGGPATDATFYSPHFITTDIEGNLYISDSYNHRIRRVDHATGIIDTYAGTEPAPSSMDNPGGGGFSGDGSHALEAELRVPSGLTFDPEGNLVFFDSGNNRLRSINKETGIITSLTTPSFYYGGFGLSMFGSDLYFCSGAYILKYAFGSSISTLGISSTLVDFGYVALGTVSNPVSLELTNTGSTDIEITNVKLLYTDANDFSYTSIPAVIPGNGSASFEVTFTPTALPATTTPQLKGTPLYRINAGGDQLADPEGEWSEDSAVSPSSYLLAGTANIETDNVTPTLDASVPAGTPPDLFTTKRLDADKNAPHMSWSFPVTNGEQYEVNLYFVEMSRCSTGNRVFQVNLEDQAVLTSFDVYAEAGGCNIGIMRSFTVDMEDDELNLNFSLLNSKPTTIAGIEVISVNDDGPSTVNISGNLQIEHSGINKIVSTFLQGSTDLDDGSFNNPPVAAFDTSSTFLTVQFNDASTDVDGAIVNWDWDFGDGNTSTAQNPLHTYAEAGTYDITLTVTDDGGASDATTTTMLLQDEPAPEGLIVSLPTTQGSAGTSGQIPLTVSDVTGEGISSYQLTLTFDETVIAFTGVDTTGTLSKLTNPIVNLTTPGEMIVAWSSAFPLAGSGTLLNLNVDYLTPGTSPLTFTTFLFNEGIPDVTATDGSIEVIASSGTGAFLASDSLVVMEAENAHVILDKNGQTWESTTTQAGFSGTSYMAALPDNGEVYKGDELAQSPELQFEVEFQEAGQYNFWARMAAPNKKGDSMHIGVNGVKHEVNSTLSVAFDGAWHWSTAFDHGNQMAFDIPAPGIYTINVWVREDGVQFDKVLFVRDASYVPVGEGPAESPQAAGPAISQANAAGDHLALTTSGQDLPETFTLKGNYPNPFNPTTTIQFELPESSAVTLEVFDMMGRRVATLVEGDFAAGRHEVQWHATTDAGNRVASGVYLYRLRANSFEMTRRMALMK